LCRGRQIKDIAWFMIIMSVLLLFIGAGTYLPFAASDNALSFFLVSTLKLFTMYFLIFALENWQEFC